MVRRLMFVAILAVMVLALAVPALANNRGGNSGKGFGTVYVTSQGLYYDTFVSVDPLPFHGNFQYIANGATAYGPGDPEYKGGRWWEDNTDPNVPGTIIGEMDPTDHFFLCPLLGPGRETP
jgi:hypothetical protein